jgi:hypothetical protein
MKFFVENGVPVNCWDPRSLEPVTPLSIAIRKGNLELVQYLWDFTENKYSDWICKENWRIAEPVEKFLESKGLYSDE